MKYQDRITTAITSLIRKTQHGVLQWKPSSPTGDITWPSEIVVDTVYLATMADGVIRLYTYRSKYCPEEHLWYWEEDVALELSDEGKKSWWRFPKHPAIRDLLEAVRFKSVGVGQFLDKLASE